MAEVPRGAPKGKKSIERFEDLYVDDLVVSDGLTLGTLDELVVDTINAITGKDLIVSGADGKNVHVKLGDDDGNEYFIVEDDQGVDLFKVRSTGVISLEGGATLDNSASASELNITETNVKVTGALQVTDAVTMATTKALTVDTINAIAAKELVITGVADNDVEIKLGDADGGEDFHVADSAGVELFKVPSNGVIALENGATIDNSSAATELKFTEDNIKLVGKQKLVGEFSTRNAADNSMYNSIAASLGHERGIIAAYDVIANDGGYFDALYANVRSGGVTGGELRGIEAKASIAHNMEAGAKAQAVYAKIAVAADAEIAEAYGVDVLLEETGTGAITKGTGIRVQGGAGAIDYAADFSGLYRNMAMKLPYATGAGEDAAAFVAGFGTSADGDVAGDSGIVGLFMDSGDSSLHLVVKVEGRYGKIAVSDA